MIANNSIIDGYVSSLDTGEASRKLLQMVNSVIYGEGLDYQQLLKTGGFYATVYTNIVFKALEKQTGITEARIKEIFSQDNPQLYREEVNSLCIVCGIGVDEIFGLPNLDSDEVIKTEYILMKGSEDAIEVIHKNPKNQKIEVKPVDDLKTELNLYCARKCLHKYPSIDDGRPS